MCLKLSPYSASGGVAAFGWNEHGMCGTGREENVGTATKVSGLPHNIEGGGILVGAGAGHSLALVQLPPQYGSSISKCTGCPVVPGGPAVPGCPVVPAGPGGPAVPGGPGGPTRLWDARAPVNMA